MNYTEPFLRKVERGKEEEQQHQHHPLSGVSYRAAVAANKKIINVIKNLLQFKKQYTQSMYNIVKATGKFTRNRIQTPKPIGSVLAIRVMDNFNIQSWNNKRLFKTSTLDSLYL